MVDCELDYDLITKMQMVDRISKFLAEFKRLSGRDCGIYTRKSWWDAEVAPPPGNTDIPRGCPLWVANYTTAAKPAIPFDWAKRYGPDAWVFWQYSADGNDQGFRFGAASDDIDINRFNGSIATFNSVFKTNIKPLITPPPVPDPAIGQYVVTSAAVNIRSSAQVAPNNIIGSTIAGTIVTVIEQTASWSHAKFVQDGWISTAMLRKL
jgi:hypothetical protein